MGPTALRIARSLSAVKQLALAVAETKFPILRYT